MRKRNEYQDRKGGGESASEGNRFRGSRSEGTRRGEGRNYDRDTREGRFRNDRDERKVLPGRGEQGRPGGRQYNEGDYSRRDSRGSDSERKVWQKGSAGDRSTGGGRADFRSDRERKNEYDSPARGGREERRSGDRPDRRSSGGREDIRRDFKENRRENNYRDQGPANRGPANRRPAFRDPASREARNDREDFRSGRGPADRGRRSDADFQPRQERDGRRSQEERSGGGFRGREDRRGFTENRRENDYRDQGPAFRGPANRGPVDRDRYEGQGTGSGYKGGRTLVKKQEPAEKAEENGSIRLNRFIANAGICSRREADTLIESGQITVNGKVISEMGYKVSPTDVVKYGKRVLNREKLVYLLLNKPKDFITTMDDPEDRKTVLSLIEGACTERVYPVGRLDRNTTGLLLLTNDGELADKLTHPSGEIRKVYQAELDKPITLEDFEAMKNGVELEDGFIKPDDLGIVTPDAYVVGIEIHSGRNRIVRRMFEHFGYDVKKLDRTTFAGLTKKDLPRGKWRLLTEKEVVRLKFLM